MFTTIPSVFQDIYHFETQYTGLAYLGRKSPFLVSSSKALSLTTTPVGVGMFVRMTEFFPLM